MDKLIFDTFMAYGDTEKIHFEIDTDNMETASKLKEKIVKAISDKPVFCNDLTGDLWMFDEKIGDGIWLENIHPSNDLTTVRAGHNLVKAFKFSFHILEEFLIKNIRFIASIRD